MTGLKGGGVLVIGEALIDVVTPPVGSALEHVGGSPANVALGLARLGIPVRFRTALGPDVRGERIAGHLAASGVVVDPASFVLDRTATAIAHLDPDRSARYEFDIQWRIDGPIALGGAGVVHVGSLGCYLEPGAETVRGFVRHVAGRARVTFDPNIRPALVHDRAAARRATEEIAAMSDLVKLSDEDAGWLYPGVSPQAVLQGFLARGARVVAMTLGRRGAVLASREASVEIDGRPVVVQDTVGAGDSFMAALVSCQASGLLGTGADSLRAAGTFAVAAASVAVGRRGADLPTRAEIDHASVIST
ncbi:MAG: carbohydrate kinase [Propionicimonas sp.]|nr:carbohydrate kinase [Propionicimonas sp.]